MTETANAANLPTDTAHEHGKAALLVPKDLPVELQDLMWPQQWIVKGRERSDKQPPTT